MLLPKKASSLPALAALAAVLLGGLSIAGLSGASSQESAPPQPPAVAAMSPELGVMGTIPLYWGEGDDIGDFLGEDVEAHWARTLLEQEYRLRPLPALNESALEGLDALLLAQPRGLSPAENVALDAWVRKGGRLLLFADPLLTGESRFGIGDPRRPQDVILLSPILRHWGLELEFVEDQPAGPALREIAGHSVPVNLPGRFSPSMQGGCTLEAGGLLADCTLGQGRAVVLADGAVLDLHDAAPEAPAALAMLVHRAFGAGDFAGQEGKPESRPAKPGASGPPFLTAGEANLAKSVRNPP